tara:strand:+ start:1482 stop:2150 length:669 start_codon:yes stop_codon:yes gene_type:complete
MSIYNSQSPFNQGAKRSEITAANKQRRQSRRQRVKDIKEAGGPEFYSADGYHVGEFDKKGRNMQYPEKRYSKKNPPNKGISGADMMSMQFHGYTDVPDSDERKSPMNQGDIKQAPSRLTQAYRRFKNDESGPYSMARNLASTAVALAPLPIGKINAVKKVGKAFSNAPKQYLKGKNMTSIPNPIPNSTKAYNKLQTYKSKPVDYMGPNPAHKIGAGKNSYPK